MKIWYSKACNFKNSTIDGPKKNTTRINGNWNCTIFTIYSTGLEKKHTHTHISFICKCMCTYQSSKQIQTISIEKYSFHFEGRSLLLLLFNLFFHHHGSNLFKLYGCKCIPFDRINREFNGGAPKKKEI